MDGQIRNGDAAKWGNVVLFLITLCATVVCAIMIRPFLPAVTGAIVLAIVTKTPYGWIRARLQNSALAASTGVVLVTLSLIGPALLLAWNIGRQALVLARMVQDGTAGRGLQRLMGHSPPQLSAHLENIISNLDVNQAIQKSAAFVALHLTAVLNGSISAITQTVIMLFILFFLYRDQAQALTSLRSLLPTTKPETDLLLSRLEDTIRATVLGRFVVAATQGLVAGITFAALSIGGASLLGIATALCGLVPAVGAFIVWVPVAVYLAATHHWVQAAILAGIGSLIISTLDNFLYPVLVGTRLRMHTVPIFLSIVGGIWLFGLSGLILGPVVFAIAESLLLIWKERTAP